MSGNAVSGKNRGASRKIVFLRPLIDISPSSGPWRQDTISMSVSRANRMWNQPYLETCCRAALHRLRLSGPGGRPADSQDAGCLARLATMGLAVQDDDGRWTMTETGAERHADEIAR
jgi:hypothetical protein